MPALFGARSQRWLTLAHVQTVLGPVHPGSLGVTLPHEHLFITLAGASPPGSGDGLQGRPISPHELDDARRRPHRYRAALALEDLDEQCRELIAFREVGGGCVVDVTPPDLGRSPARLVELARRSGVAVVMGCGHFVHTFHPPGLAAMDEEEIQAEILRDLVAGVDGVRAGIIGEIGLGWPHHPEEERVLRAAARASAATGVALTVHPGHAARSCFRALEVVAEAGGAPERTVIGHLERTLFDLEDFVALARTGCYLEFDLFGREVIHHPLAPRGKPGDVVRIEWMVRLAERGFGDQLLASHDVAYRTDLRAYGGPGYAHLLTSVVSVMRGRGMPEELIRALLVDNPTRMLAVADGEGDEPGRVQG